MTTPLTGRRVVLATHNPGKLAEFQAALANMGVELISAGELGLPEPDETGATFAANAKIKARSAAEASGLPALADDSGLAVAALDGAPGVYSARWAGPEKDFAAAMAMVESEVGKTGGDDPRAAFVCVLAFVDEDGHETLAEGRVDGELVFPPRGNAGFGYDPIFAPTGEARTFAEMTRDEKATFSHRGRALAALQEKLSS